MPTSRVAGGALAGRGAPASGRLTTRNRGTRQLVAASVVAAAFSSSCATGGLPAPGVAEKARAASSYSASLRASLRGPDVRGGTRVLLAFRKPDALRLEIPGPTGARLVAVASEGRLVAVFPSDRAVFEGAATAAEMDALVGVALAPGELMDLLTGTAPARLKSYRARWGSALPREIEAVLPDGSKLTAKVEEAEADPALAASVFAPPAHRDYRVVDAAEARRLWSPR